MSAFTVLYLGGEPGYEATRAALADIATVVHVPAETDAVSAALPGADAVLDASMKTRLTSDMLATAPRLCIISCATTGADHIEGETLEARGIALRTLKEDRPVLQELTPAAELSWALLMACARRLVPAVAHVRDGRWVREDFPGVMLNGKRLGLVGLGRIGGWMARYASAFGMTVAAYDPGLEDWPEGVASATLPALFAESDFVSIHVHLSEATRGLVSAGLLAEAKPGLILINTSRGAVVDEAALLRGLETGRIGAAGLDVLDGEPEIGNHPLVEYARRHDNLLITPHCGGNSPDAVRKVCRHAAGKIRAVLTEAG